MDFEIFLNKQKRAGRIYQLLDLHCSGVPKGNLNRCCRRESVVEKPSSTMFNEINRCLYFSRSTFNGLLFPLSHLARVVGSIFSSLASAFREGARARR